MLHGEINVNYNEIAQWSAVRKENVGEDRHRYECYVQYRGLDGYLQEGRFDVVHPFGAGALVLAAAVLNVAGDFLKRKENLDG